MTIPSPRVKRGLFLWEEKDIILIYFRRSICIEGEKITVGV